MKKGELFLKLKRNGGIWQFALAFILTLCLPCSAQD